MALEKQSPCKVNLLLNVLGRRADGFHELETIMHPVAICDRLTIERAAKGITLTCSDASLATDSRNLVFRSAAAFLEIAKIKDGVRLHLEKRIPVAAGLGGGSGNAATTLAGLNELFGNPLSGQDLFSLAAALGSDIPFFLQNRPALALGRGEKVESLRPFAALNGAYFVIVHPGFGISTPWAYQQLQRFPEALNGRAGRAGKLIDLLHGNDLAAAGRELYNSLEAPALEKYPILALFQELFRSEGAAALMSGSGSSTFAIVLDKLKAEKLIEGFKEKFGANNWVAAVAIQSD
jgi:4-diphosphocytidyl-2-C-methyl-D-erythritol kinase